MDLALNNLQWLISNKIQPTNQDKQKITGIVVELRTNIKELVSLLGLV